MTTLIISYIVRTPLIPEEFAELYQHVLGFSTFFV